MSPAQAPHDESDHPRMAFEASRVAIALLEGTSVTIKTVSLMVCYRLAPRSEPGV
jgi:hypothetical protein